jgi:predicted nucleotidyltransferase
VAEPVPKPFLKALADLTQWLEDSSVPAIIIGGVAASILGRPRATRDIDALAIAPDDRRAAILAAAASHGLEARVADPLGFAERTRVLLLRHIDSSVDVDVIFGGLPFEEESIRRSQLHDLGGVLIRLPRVEDLLIMKAIAQRPHDLRDIEGLLDAHPEADLNRVRQWVSEFAAAMSMSDLLDTFDKLLTQRRRKD